MKTCGFVIDVPDWALGQYVQRLTPHFARVKPVAIPLVPSLAGLRAGEAPDYSTIPARLDALYCTSWWFAWELIQRKALPPHAALLVDVVDEYAWKRSPGPMGVVRAHADAVLTQSLGYLTTDPCATFHPFPVPPAYLARPRPRRAMGDRLRVGMVANGWRHSATDHKGVELARSVVAGLPWVELEIAGTDRVIAPTDMVQWYDSLDGFLTLSLSEGFSNATADALALGVPVVGTGISPLVPFVGGVSSGSDLYLPTTRDPGDVAHALVSLREHYPARRLAALAARDVASAWSAERVAAGVERQILGAVHRFAYERTRRHPNGL